MSATAQKEEGVQKKMQFSSAMRANWLKTAAPTHCCSIIPHPKTNGAYCPWSRSAALIPPPRATVSGCSTLLVPWPYYLSRVEKCKPCCVCTSSGGGETEQKKKTNRSYFCIFSLCNSHRLCSRNDRSQSLDCVLQSSTLPAVPSSTTTPAIDIAV